MIGFLINCGCNDNSGINSDEINCNKISESGQTALGLEYLFSPLFLYEEWREISVPILNYVTLVVAVLFDFKKCHLVVIVIAKQYTNVKNGTNPNLLKIRFGS